MDNQPVYHYLYGERRIEHVPRPPLYRPPVESFPGISFHICPGQIGVFVMDLMRDRVTIEGANDPVLEQYGWRATTINLEWPGFVPTTHNNPMRARIDTHHRDGQPITRLEFAKEICGLLLNFHKYCGRYPLTPGWERWSMNPDTQGIRMTDLVLLSVHYYRNVWVPELYVK